MKTGTNNLITDVDGFLVGHASDDHIKTGVTVFTAQQAFTAAVQVMGGAPGTRETDLLAPDRLVQKVHALVLAGGSAFGLEAASGVADTLSARGIGIDALTRKIPIVPGAILFDLVNGGNKDWAKNPYKQLGTEALKAAASEFMLGSVGVGTGALTARHKGGLGSASLVLPSGITLGALVGVNALGSTLSLSGHFHAAPFEIGDEFGGRGMAPQADPLAETFNTKVASINTATTIAIIATDADLTQAQLHRVATAAHDGIGRAIYPAHTPFDGDLVFAASSNKRPLQNGDLEMMDLCHAASVCLSRAIARGVWEATPTDTDTKPCARTS
jgi:D-aminopeptidase